NDPKVAPEGYLVRSNFAITGGGKSGKKRYERGDGLFKQAVAEKKLSYRHILRNISRDLDGAVSVPNPQDNNGGEVLDNRDAISSCNTVATALFHGVKSNESPSLTTFWALLGEPTFSVAVPSWVIAESVAPEIDGEEESPLCEVVLAFRRANYMVDQDICYLIPDKIEEIQGLTFDIEDRIFDQTEIIMEQWRNAYPTSQQV
ncbi:MAG: hypothetical protein GY869_29100, partial [Planctomycetes bacterium]|nr:hypothetical protein [Planctomycetota bacterium]